MTDKKLTKDEIEKLVLAERQKLATEDKHISITEDNAYVLVSRDFINSFVGIHGITPKGFRTFSIKSKKPVENDNVSETTKIGNMKRRLTNAKNKNVVGVDSKNGYRIANIKTAFLIKSKNRTYRIVPTKTN